MRTDIFLNLEYKEGDCGHTWCFASVSSFYSRITTVFCPKCKKCAMPITPADGQSCRFCHPEKRAVVVVAPHKYNKLTEIGLCEDHFHEFPGQFRFRYFDKTKENMYVATSFYGSGEGEICFGYYSLDLVNILVERNLLKSPMALKLDFSINQGQRMGILSKKKEQFLCLTCHDFCKKGYQIDSVMSPFYDKETGVCEYCIKKMLRTLCP